MSDEVQVVNPFQVPPDRQGWRGLSLEGSSKRKWYTLLHNEQVLVTALVLLPGETSVRHSHETGELSIVYLDPMQPIVKWNPPGVLHAGPEAPVELPAPPALTSKSDDPMAQQLLQRLGILETEIRRLTAELQDLKHPAPRPMVLVDVLFPPFETTIDDPRYGKKTVTGQWFD